MADNSAEYEIRLKDLFSKQLDAIESKMNGFEAKVNSVGTSMGNVFGGAFLAQAAWKAVGAIDKVSESVIELGMNMEKTRVVFATLFGGNADFANSMIAKFQKFAQATPFSTEDVLAGAKRLTAAKVAAQDLIPVMSKLGDISSGTGNRFDYVAWLYGHTKSYGHLTGRLRNEFQNATIDIMGELEKKYKVSGSKINEMIKKSLISFKDVDEALSTMTAKGGQFFDLNNKISQTTGGRWERFKDTLEIIGVKMGEQLLPELNKWLDYGFESIKGFATVDMGPLIASLDAVWGTAIKIGDAFSSVSDLFNDNSGKSWGDHFLRVMRLGSDLLAWGALQIEHTVALLKDSKDFLTGKATWGDASWTPHLDATQNIADFNSAIAAREHGIVDAQSSKKIASYYISKGNGVKSFDEMMGFTPKGKNYNDDDGSDHSDGYGSGSGVEKIQSGSRNITLNIGKLIETVNFTKSYQQSEEELKDMLTRALLSEVNNVNIAAD